VKLDARKEKKKSTQWQKYSTTRGDSEICQLQSLNSCSSFNRVVWKNEISEK
jgi:hypothetical protein